MKRNLITFLHNEDTLVNFQSEGGNSKSLLAVYYILRHKQVPGKAHQASCKLALPGDEFCFIINVGKKFMCFVFT